MAAAAAVFWGDIANRDDSLPLGRLAARRGRLDLDAGTCRLAVFVDGVSDLIEARRLVEQPWEEWGCRLVLTVPPPVAAAVRSHLGDRGRVAEVPDFTPRELRTFLADAAEVRWDDIPFDVLQTLRRPLLAYLFRSVVPPAGWQPRREYELYERSWDSLSTRGAKSLAIAALRMLAGSVLQGGEYPWPAAALQAAGLDQASVDQLVIGGWLRESGRGAYEVWHDRLLNWAVAEWAADAMCRNADEADAACAAVAKLFREPRTKSGRFLGYAPLDALWLLAAPPTGDATWFSSLAGRCEAALGRRATERLHVGLLPTLGERAVPYLTELVRLAAETADYEVEELVGALVATGEPGLAGRGAAFLAHPDPLVQRAGVLVLTRVPDKAVAERLWWVHAESIRNPTPYLRGGEGDWSLYEDTYAALRAVVRVAPAWLERAIQTADPSAPMHDLAYLVAGCGDAGLWHRQKGTLMALVDPGRERSIATCIYAYRDASELEWLEARVSRTDDALGPAALRALAALAPETALALFDRLPPFEQYLTRNWCFGELYGRLPERAMAHFVARLRTHAEPLRYADLLQGREDVIDAESFDFLLDQLAQALTNVACSESPHRLTPECRRGLAFVNAVSRPDLLVRIRNRRGMPLETALVTWMLAAGPRRGISYAPDRGAGLDALARIGGDGLNRVLDDWLDRGDWYAKYDAVQYARRRVTPATVERLKRVSGQPEDNGSELSRWVPSDAIATLAVHECWEPVIAYYLRVGLDCSTTVDECAPIPAPPLGDVVLSPALDCLPGTGPAAAGAILAVGLSGRTDLLSLVRSTLRGAAPQSPVALACSLALTWLGDTAPDAVPLLVPSLPHPHATNALLANWSVEAVQALAAAFSESDDPHVAAILVNEPRCREVGRMMIARMMGRPRGCAAETFSVLVDCLDREMLRDVADCPQVFARAEEVAFGSHEAAVGEKAAALRVVGQQDPAAAVRTAARRFRDPGRRDAGRYTELLAEFTADAAATALLEAARVNPPTRVAAALGCALRIGDGPQVVIAWLADATPDRALAACRVAGFLDPSMNLVAAVGRCVDHPDRRVSAAAFAAREQLRRAAVVDLLVEALRVETDGPHRWTLLDALATAADPGDETGSPPWLETIRDGLTPAMRKFAGKRLKERRDELHKEWERQDRNRG